MLRVFAVLRKHNLVGTSHKPMHQALFFTCHPPSMFQLILKMTVREVICSRHSAGKWRWDSASGSGLLFSNLNSVFTVFQPLLSLSKLEWGLSNSVRNGARFPGYLPTQWSVVWEVQWVDKSVGSRIKLLESESQLCHIQLLKRKIEAQGGVPSAQPSHHTGLNKLRYSLSLPPAICQWGIFWSASLRRSAVTCTLSMFPERNWGDLHYKIVALPLRGSGLTWNPFFSFTNNFPLTSCI